MLAATDAASLYTSTIRGHDPVPDGQIINPLELREVVIVMHDDAKVYDHPIAKAAMACGSKDATHPHTYRFQVKSQNIDGDIVGILALDRDRMVWLEFDESGWVESDYNRVLTLALEKAREL